MRRWNSCENGSARVVVVLEKRWFKYEGGQPVGFPRGWVDCVITDTVTEQLYSTGFQMKILVSIDSNNVNFKLETIFHSKVVSAQC